MTTSHTTFVLLAERRFPDRRDGFAALARTRSAHRRPFRAVLDAVPGFRAAGTRPSVAGTDVDPAPARSS
jgi:hypothetical protein